MTKPLDQLIGAEHAQVWFVKSRSTLIGVVAVVTLTAFLAGCTAPSPDPTIAVEIPRATASESVTPPGTPTPTVSAADAPDFGNSTEPVSFTLECYVFDAEGGGRYLPYDSMEAAWGNPDVLSCKGEQHGQVITAQQQEAISVSLPSFGYDDPYLILETLYSQCATANHGYLYTDKYTGFQVENVRGILALCPHHPGADKLHAGLPAD